MSVEERLEKSEQAPVSWFLPETLKARLDLAVVLAAVVYVGHGDGPVGVVESLAVTYGATVAVRMFTWPRISRVTLWWPRQTWASRSLGWFLFAGFITPAVRSFEINALEMLMHVMSPYLMFLFLRGSYFLILSRSEEEETLENL